MKPIRLLLFSFALCCCVVTPARSESHQPASGTVLSTTDSLAQQTTPVSTTIEPNQTNQTNQTTTERRIKLDEADARQLGSILIVILVLSVVFEIALTPIFNWRYFIKHLDKTGAKTPIQILSALLIFWNFELDIVRDLLNTMTNVPVPTSWPGKVLTAFLIAGGSSGIYDILNRLGIQDYNKRRQEVLSEEVSAASSTQDASSALSSNPVASPTRIVPIVKRG